NPFKFDIATPNLRPQFPGQLGIIVSGIFPIDPLLIATFSRADLNVYLAKKAGEGGSILPAALYRRQVPSHKFPHVTGDVIQVSPLVRRVAGAASASSFGIIDPFIGVEVEGTRGVEWLRQPHPDAPDNSRYFRWKWESI